MLSMLIQMIDNQDDRPSSWAKCASMTDMSCMFCKISISNDVGVHQFSYAPEILKLPQNPMFFEIRIEINWHETITVLKCQTILKSFQACTVCISEPCNHRWISYTSLSCQFQTHGMRIQLNKVFEIGIRSLSMHFDTWNKLMSMHLKSYVNSSRTEIFFRSGHKTDTSISQNRPSWTLPLLPLTKLWRQLNQSIYFIWDIRWVVLATACKVRPAGCIDICQCILDSFPWRGRR